MEFKGTKGKWILTYPIVTSEEEDVCELFLHLEAYMDNKNAEQEKISKSNALLISKEPEMFDLISEMREALIWYQDNCTPVETSRSNDEIFYNLGMNLRQESERLQIEATEL